MASSKAGIDSARSNFLLSHRESARIFSTNRAELGKEENPGSRKRLCKPVKFFRRGISKRPEMTSPYEKSEKAKTTKNNERKSNYEKSKQPRLQRCSTADRHVHNNPLGA